MTVVQRRTSASTRRPKAAGEEPAIPTLAVDTETPEEALETAHAKMTASLASDLLTRWLAFARRDR